MPVNNETTYKTWERYAYVRDNGHTKFIEKADRCEKFFAGDQWAPADRAALERNRRPVLTINKIMSTMSNVMGEQINNRSEISFRPRAGASSGTADVLSKVFKQISDNNQLAWLRSDLFADGVITSRGFLDVRIETGDNMQGEVKITGLNGKNVMIDPDGEEYDPDTWGEVWTTKWMTVDDIAVMYSPQDAELLKIRTGSSLPYGYDSIQMNRDSFGGAQNPMYSGYQDFANVVRNVRVIERQFRTLDRQKHFMSPETGDMRPIPEEFDRNRIAMFVDQYGFRVVPKLVRRIKWFAMADNVELHNDWSPYQHYTIVPYFPHFRKGTTIGLVENLLGPQELLNKVTSQELHVVNTTANSGYKVKAGALTNMTVEELEEKGAQTGLVIEVNGDPDKDVQKIAPNQVPQGLDRISYKAEESIKTISGVSDSMQGMDRADVAAKAIQQKRQAGSTNLVKPLANLVRSDFFLARNILALVQEFYTESRMLTITKDHATGETETFGINQPNPEPETGEEESPYQEILNDLTLGEYDVIVTSVPHRESLEDSQFEQAMAMKEAGIMIPDTVLIDSSRLMNKKEIIDQMNAANQSPEAQAAQQLQMRGQAAEVAKTEAETVHKQADAQLKTAKVGETQAKTQEIMNGPQDDGGGQAKMVEAEKKTQVMDHKMGMDEQKAAQDMSLAERKHQLEREKLDADIQMKERDLEQKRMDARVQAARDAAIAAAKPPATGQTANRSHLPTSK